MAAADPTFSCTACGKDYRWKPEMAGRKAKCACGATLVVPAERPAGGPPPPAPSEAATKPASGASCPSCGAALPSGAVLCVNCGYNLKTGKQLSVVVEREADVAAEPAAKPAAPPAVQRGAPPEPA